MSATLAGAIKAKLEAAGLGLVVYREGRPKTGWAYPYVVVTEGIARTPQPHGDRGDPARHGGTAEQVQVDLYQQSRKADTATAGRVAMAEDFTLPGKLERQLQGATSYGTAPVVRVYGLRVLAGRRWPVADNVVRDTWTVEAQRDT